MADIVPNPIWSWWQWWDYTGASAPLSPDLVTAIQRQVRRAPPPGLAEVPILGTSGVARRMTGGLWEGTIPAYVRNPTAQIKLLEASRDYHPDETYTLEAKVRIRVFADTERQARVIAEDLMGRFAHVGGYPPIRYRGRKEQNRWPDKFLAEDPPGVGRQGVNQRFAEFQVVFLLASYPPPPED